MNPTNASADAHPTATTTADTSADEYGVLFSHAPGADVVGGFDTLRAAVIHAHSVLDAQRGIGFTLMARRAATEWRELGTERRPIEAVRRHWH